MDKPKKTFAELRREARESAPSRFSRKELAQLALLKDAHQEAIVPLLRDCPVQQLEIGETLLCAGESCNALYLVLSGQLRMQDPSSTVPDRVVKAGDSVGELFLMQNAIVAWTISAVKPTRLLVINQDVAWALIGASHEAARNWLTLLAERAGGGGIVRASEELKTSYKRHATLDDCTGLHNRLWLESTLPRQVARSCISKAPLSLLLVEIDGFDDYRAELGAEAAEHVRYAVAQTLTHNVRPTDLTACYDTATFAVVLPEAEVSGACTVGERVRHAVSEAVIMMSDESILPSVTVSVGAAQYTSSDAPALMKAAEAALESAKTIGGDRVGMQLAGG
jgi:diguanylate cyclase (GGDEF)-like protein